MTMNPAHFKDGWPDRVGERGLLLIRTFMDEMVYHSRGNPIPRIRRPRRPQEMST